MSGTRLSCAFSSGIWTCQDQVTHAGPMVAAAATVAADRAPTAHLLPTIYLNLGRALRILAALSFVDHVIPLPCSRDVVLHAGVASQRLELVPSVGPAVWQQ